MTKKLHCILLALFAAVFNTAMAQEVTLDFTENTWGLPNGSSEKLVDAANFTSGSYTITLQGSEGGGYYHHATGQYLLFGKSGATLTLPAFDFDVEKIAITGTSGASAAVKQNIFVGDTEVSTETTGAKEVTNEYAIAEAYQKAGTVYQLKVLSNHNTQVSKIEIYKKGAGGPTKTQPEMAFDPTAVTVTIGESVTPPTLTYNGDGTVTYTSSNEQVATVDASTGALTVLAVGSATITANATETDKFLGATAQYKLTVTAFSSHAQNYKLGDVNRDGDVTVADVTMLVDIILKGYTPFIVSPTAVTMSAGSTATVDVVSGYYQYEVMSANTNVVTASLNGSVITLTAVASGETKVIVMDVQTMRYLEVPVTVAYASLQLSASQMTLVMGSEGDIDISSGSGSYSVASSDASVATASVNNGKVSVAAIGAGSATITVTDTQSGQTATIEVSVDYLPLALSSTSVNLFIGGESSVGISSGSGSYSVESSDSNVASAELDGNTVSIIAFGGGTATITVTDTKSGQTQDIIVTVDYLPLQLSANSLTLNIGEEGAVSITSGNGNFTVRSSDTGVATATLSGNSVKVTAVTAGTANITVTDRRSGQTATIEVTVSAGPTSYLTCPDENHPHMIDLGLPSGTKWACCNVDTDHPEKQSPTNYGGYYAWGETETKSGYSESTYQYYKNGSYQSLGSDISGTRYDVAHVKWGGSWVMPSKEQIDELRNNCTSTWTTQNDVSGRLFSGKNGGSIFLPAAGGRNDSGLHIAGSGGYYWSSAQSPSDADYAYYLSFGSGGSNAYDYYRYYGKSVRPVVRN